jgi:cystathionine beta-lyase/cystathionine gamma-synthase
MSIQKRKETIMKIETQCVHTGGFEDTLTGGINTPIFTSSVYRYLETDIRIYPRYFNTPNQNAVVRKLCALEGAQDGVLFSSGMAAITTVLMALLSSGDHAIIQDDIYGGTHAFITGHFSRYGIEYTLVPNNAEEVDSAIQPSTKLIFIESPTNPLLKIMDIRGVAAVARKRGIFTVIDNTFASPVNQNPLALGIDIVVHSGTKYLGGHSDLCCGAVLSSGALIEGIRKMAQNLGGSLNALTCSLLERSLKTLSVRVERQTENAKGIARFLSSHPRVKSVNYPGLESHPQYEIARSQMRGFGAMLSFELDPVFLNSRQFLKKLMLITPAVSLGGVETIICEPATTSHQKVSAEVRRRMGISDNLLRLSVGIEHADDLIEDLVQAMD